MGNIAQKLEQGSIGFIDVPTQLPDLSPAKGILLPLLDLIRRYIETLRGATPTRLIFDELGLLAWIGNSAICFTLCACPRVIFCKGECERSDPLPPIYTNSESNSEMTYSYWSYDIHIPAPDDLRPRCVDTAPTLYMPY
jgi:hypothetical protein